MRYKISFLLVAFLLLRMEIYAQQFDIAPMICKMEENSRGGYGGYDDTIYRPYIPYKQAGSISVHVTLVFLQQDDGTGGFQANNQEHQRIWDEVEVHLNQMYANMKNSDLSVCYKWKDPFLTDTKIRFKFHKVYIKDSYAWDRNNNVDITWDGYQAPPLDYIEYIQKRIGEDKSISQGINVFFTEDSKLYKKYIRYGNYIPEGEDSMANYAAAIRPWGKYIQIHMPDVYCKYLWMKYGVTHHRNLDWENTIRVWLVNSLGAGLAHELGHCLDLEHRCSHYATNECPPALMNQVGGSARDYVPPTEIGKMHKALMESELKEFVDSDAPIFGTWSVSNITLKGCRIYSNLHIPYGSKTTMKGSFSVPQKAKIEVEGFLSIEKPYWTLQIPVIVQCQDKNSYWEGIRVRKGGVLYLEDIRMIDYDIIMESGSTLILAGSIEVQNGHKIVLDSGVYVCATSSFTKSPEKPFYANVNTLNKGIPTDVARLYGISCSSINQWDAFVASINPIPEILYIQNQNITGTNTFVAKTILVGNSVNGSRTKGDVVIKSPVKATFIYKDRIFFDKGFRCESGASYRVIPYK